jgi:alpha-1,2-glucosyltransferase
MSFQILADRFPGDKSNHVATVHVPQMLYLWPYLLFFSIPVVVPPVITSAMNVFTHPPSVGNMFRQILTFTIATILAATVIHYNTIVHPFTLADNRHYVFYVFRILLRHPAIRYLAAPAYVACANIAIQALGGRKSSQKSTLKSERENPAVIHSSGCTTSFVIIWLATTALSLVTAPLVEPRYCIIPWIMWRLHVPRSVVIATEKKAVTGNPLLKVLQNDQTRLLFETIWFCCINAVTGYIFLYWGFEWPQEEGKVQRFMW